MQGVTNVRGKTFSAPEASIIIPLQKITEMMDKGAVITLDEGGEGFATPKHLVKEDGTQAQLGEELSFKVIEFVKDTKRIILSHSRTFEQAKEETKPARKHTAKKEAAPTINNVAASTTLGDLDALAELKAKMEKGESSIHFIIQYLSDMLR